MSKRSLPNPPPAPYAKKSKTEAGSSTWKQFPIIAPSKSAYFKPYVAKPAVITDYANQDEKDKVPEHREYHVCKFKGGSAPPAKNMSKLRFLRAQKPIMTKMDDDEPAPGSQASKRWHMKRRQNIRRYRKELMKPPLWDLQDPKTRQTWQGQPEKAWGSFRSKVKSKQAKYLLLSFDDMTQNFTCHTVENYGFKRDYKSRVQTIEEAEAEMKRMHRPNYQPKNNGESPGLSLSSKLLAASKKEEDSSNNQPKQPTQEERVFVHKGNSETYNIYSSMKTEEGCYDGDNSDDNSDEQQVGEENDEELTLEERQNMTNKQKKLRKGMILINEGKTLETVSKEVTDKNAAQEIPDGDDYGDRNAEFDEFFSSTKGGDDNDDDEDLDDDIDVSDLSVTDEESEPLDKKKSTNSEPKVDASSESDEEDDQSGEEEKKTVSITAQDIKQALRASATARMEVLTLTHKLKSKLKSKLDVETFKNLLRELCSIKVSHDDKTYVILKEEEERIRKRAKARQQREEAREKRRQEKARARQAKR